MPGDEGYAIIMWLQVSWLVWIAAGVLLNGGLQWKAYLPAILQDALHYGKLKLSPGRWRPLQASPWWSQLLNVPKRWFTHFYAWGLFWNLSLLICYLISCVAILPESLELLAVLTRPLVRTLMGVDLALTCRTSGGISQRQFDVAMVLFLVCVQVTRRLYECVFVSVFSPDGRMHMIHYVMGLYFYTALGPTAILHLTFGIPDQMSPDGFGIRWYHAMGLLLFLVGSWHQHKCHKILAGLRRRKAPLRSQVSTTASHPAKKLTAAGGNAEGGSYGLPRGDWFELVSSPHYFAEILIYLGILVVLTVDDHWTAWWLVLTFVVSTLTLGARQTHSWYLEKFDEYPKFRRVLIPGVY